MHQTESDHNHVKGRLNSDGSGTIYSSLTLFLDRVGEVILGLTSTISDAPIMLNALLISHLFRNRSLQELITILQQHYLSSALGQLYKIVGSLDLMVGDLLIGTYTFLYCISKFTIP